MRPPGSNMNLSVILCFITVLLLTGSPIVNAFWRLLCHGTLGTARIDPVVNFGEIAPHVHKIAGASNFGFFSDTADLQASDCTSCEIVQDKSAYWAPALYFQHDNGSFELVQTSGGMTVYYFTDNAENVTDSDNNTVLELLTAFPPDFRMVAGNNSLRDFPYPQPDRDMSDWKPEDKTQAALAAKALGFNCMHYYNGATTEGSMEFHQLRNKTFLDATCAQGVRFEIEFPSCWDGVRLDSEDHKSHILYPEGIKTGPCPDGFNVRTPVMFFETIWNTFDFTGQPGRFVIANGDTEGNGYHGDFYSGWDQNFLQQAINTCTNESGIAQDCDLFTLQDDSIATNCFLDMPEELQGEASQGLLSALPGNVPIATGPGLAPKMKGTPVLGTTKAQAPTTLASASTFAQDSVGAAPSSAYPAATSITTPLPSSTSTSSYTSPPQTFSTSPAPSCTATTAALTSGDNQPLSIMATSVYTSNGHEVHLIIFEEIVTVTDVVEASSKRKAHKHSDRHARNRI